MKLPRHIRRAIRLQEGALTAWLDQKFPDKKLRVEYDTRPVEVTPKDEEHNTGTSEDA